MDTLTASDTRSRAIEFLGLGYSQELVAQTIGVTPERISQLMAEETFREAVRQRRMAQLTKHTQIDERYDNLEERLLVRLEKALPLLVKPRDILDGIKTVNAAKRRGAPPAPVNESARIVQISMPTQILQQFIAVEKLPNNQIVKAGEQNLLTINSQTLVKEAHAKESLAPPTTPQELTNDRTGTTGKETEGVREDSPNKAGIPGETRELCAADFD